MVRWIDGELADAMAATIDTPLMNCTNFRIQKTCVLIMIICDVTVTPWTLANWKLWGILGKVIAKKHVGVISQIRPSVDRWDIHLRFGTF